MTNPSKDKGSRAERAVADYLIERGVPGPSDYAAPRLEAIAKQRRAPAFAFSTTKRF